MEDNFQNLFAEYHRTLIEEMERRWAGFIDRRLDMLRVSVPSNGISQFSAISTKILQAFFFRFWQTDLKIAWESKELD